MTDKTFVPARTPRGAETTIKTPSIELRGELIEVRSSAIVILTSGIKARNSHTWREECVFRQVPYASISYAAFNQLNSPYVLGNGRAPTGKVLERLRLVSRFPYGMSAEVLTQLLQANGQTVLAGLEP